MHRVPSRKNTMIEQCDARTDMNCEPFHNGDFQKLPANMVPHEAFCPAIGIDADTDRTYS